MTKRAIDNTIESNSQRNRNSIVFDCTKRAHDRVCASCARIAHNNNNNNSSITSKWREREKKVTASESLTLRVRYAMIKWCEHQLSGLRLNNSKTINDEIEKRRTTTLHVFVHKWAIASSKCAQNCMEIVEFSCRQKMSENKRRKNNKTTKWWDETKNV